MTLINSLVFVLEVLAYFDQDIKQNEAAQLRKYVTKLVFVSK